MSISSNFVRVFRQHSVDEIITLQRKLINITMRWIIWGVILVVVVVIILVIFGCKKYKPQSTYFFSITDENGTESYIHDSGIYAKDSLTPSRELTLRVLKEEINEGIPKTLSTPKVLRIGRHPKDLNRVIDLYDQNIKEELDMYVIKVAL